MFCMILSGFPLIFWFFCSVSDGKSCFTFRKSISTSKLHAKHPFTGQNTQQIARGLFFVKSVPYLVIVKLVGKNLSIIVSNVYAPNNHNEEYFDHLKEIMLDIHIVHPTLPVIMLGDGDSINFLQWFYSNYSGFYPLYLS